MKSRFSFCFIDPWILLFLIGVFPTLNAQLILPLEEPFYEAVQKGTRSMDGKAGPNYFQNRADYLIEASVDPETRQLRGSESIRYVNNSPDTLAEIVIRLYQDMYKPDPGFQRDDKLDESELTEGVNISRMVWNGRALSIKGSEKAFRRAGTNLFLTLPDPMLPGQKMELEIDWQFQIPNGHTVRMGTYGENAFFVAYWYPQIAVYDDVFGWDAFNYTGLQEFYNEFGNFDVRLTVPDDFLVWATGELRNPEAVLHDEPLARYRKAMTTDSVIKIVTKANYKTGAVARKSANGKNTWHFQADNVPDFAFASCDYYYWDATSVEIDGRRVLVDACYKPQAKDFKEVAGFAAEIIEGLSTGMPGIPYPYPAMTIFNGEISGGGMEYPMMVNDASTFFKGFTFGLTAHEITHTYFPFYMGINEHRFAWMDEGWASMLPYDLIEKRGFKMMGPGMDVTSYASYALHKTEKPLMTYSVDLKGNAYGVHAYSKPATAYNILRNLLGDEKFKAAMALYIENWNGKHPQPYDFFFSFNQAAGEDLSWFWGPWFFEALVPDLKIKSVNGNGRKVKVRIDNPNGVPLPIVLDFKLKSGKTEHYETTAAIWKDGETSVEIEIRLADKLKEVNLGASWIPDSDRSNNRYKK